MSRHILPTDKVFDKAREILDQGKSAVLATVVRAEAPTSAKPGAKAFISDDGEIIGWIGGGCAQPAVVQTAEMVLKDAQPRLIRVSPKSDVIAGPGILDYSSSCFSGGTLDIFLEPVLARPSVAIFGASPVAQALSRLCPLAGFHIQACVPNVSEELFPDADQLVDGFNVHSQPKSIVVATMGKRDMPGLEAALKTDVGHIAFVASAKKFARLRQNLLDKGYSEESLMRIQSPCGIEIGAETPEEISVSIMAELVKYKNTQSLDETPKVNISKIEEEKVTPLKKATTSCCGSKSKKTSAKGAS